MKIPKQLFTVDNAKTSKGESLGFLTAILYMAPYKLSGMNLCPFATTGCIKSCLNTAGRGRFDSIQQARLNKALFFRHERKAFLALLKKEVLRVIRKANRENLTLAIRLNGTSDIAWENLIIEDGKNIFDLFPQVQFYDYTKNWHRFRKQLPSNYHLTFSYSEENHDKAIEIFNAGHNVAVVFDQVPTEYKGLSVMNGDETDLRFLDEKNKLIGLTAKGDAKKDQSGFVVRLAS